MFESHISWAVNNIGGCLKEDILEVLIYLFENYMVDGVSFEPGQEELARELIGAGFEGEEIDKAFVWLEGLMNIYQQDEAQRFSVQTHQSIRFFTEQERQRLSLEAQSLLSRLVGVGVLDQYSREMVVDRVMALDLVDVNLDHVRWVVLMVLSNQPGFYEIAEWAEVIISDVRLPVFH